MGGEVETLLHARGGVETPPCGRNGDTENSLVALGQINQHVQSGSGNENVVDWELKKIIGGRSVLVAYLCHQSVPVAIQWLSCHRISGTN